MTITLCTDSLENVENVEENLFYFNNITGEKLLDIAKRNGCFIDKVNLEESKRFKSKELQILEKNIYKVDNEKFLEFTSDINLFIAKNLESEVENVARNIVNLVRKKSYRFRDIAVVCNNIDTYSSDIKAVFNKYEIPVFIDEKKDINNNILMKYIISLLNILTTNFSYESMFSYIKSGMLDLDEEDIYILENYVNKWGIRGSKWHKEEFVYEEKNIEKPKKATEFIEKFVYAEAMRHPENYDKIGDFVKETITAVEENSNISFTYNYPGTLDYSI